MKKTQKEEPPPPDPSDLEGWRRATRAPGQLTPYRPEVLVAALQDLGPQADNAVRNALAKHLSSVLIKMLRGYIGTNHPNRGEDMILRAHDQMFEALLQKDSADGCALRTAFGYTVKFRALDAIATEYLHSRVPLAPKVRKPKANEDEEDIATDEKKTVEVEHLVHHGQSSESEENNGFVDDDTVSNASRPDPALLEGVIHTDEAIDVERTLARIKDFRKRLAFRLFMNDIPFGSKKTMSIAEALNISPETAENWVEEARKLLMETDEVRELSRMEAGEKS